MLGLIKNKS